MKVLVLNGPNLGRLGLREPEIYGAITHSDLTKLCKAWGADLGLEVEVRQTDSESELINWINEANSNQIPVILNSAAFTHYSYALADACRSHSAPLIEVHISNPHAREEFRHKSVISPVATGTISGFGVNSYHLALIQVASFKQDQ